MPSKGNTFAYVDYIRIGQNKIGIVLEVQEILSIDQVAAMCR
jgi:hypothetical protein